MRFTSALFLSSLAVSLGAAKATPRFEHETIDDSIAIGYGLAVADVNGDGREDILLVDKEEVVWYESPTWEKHVLTGKLTERDNVSIAARDINGDGKAEVAIGAEWNPGDTENSGAVFYLIAPEDPTDKWTPVKLHHEPTVHRMAWANSRLVVAPLHGRGNRGGQGAGVKLLEYTMSDKPEGVWRTSVIDDTMHMTHNLDVVQWDEDQAEELLYCGREAVLLLDRQGDGTWHREVLVSKEKNDAFAGAGEVRAGNLKGSRIIATIEPMHGNKAVVYTRGEGKEWQRQVLDDSLADGHAVACADLLGSGSDQVVIGWRNKNADGKVGIKMFVPNENGTEWKEVWIDDNQMACEDLKVADLNNDGRADIVAAGRATKNVKIYWNKGE